MGVIQDYDNDKLAFELTGFPYTGPQPGETFKATIIFQNPTGLRPYGDAFMVSWNVLNGPVALVTVEDQVSINSLDPNDFTTDSIT